jgi:ribosome-associated toxin RatA of RatAB toxin-antitoxin module
VPVIKKSALVRHSAQQMFDLVADVEGYPAFLPWCASTELLSKTEEKICGRIEVARLGVRQRFATCNRIDPPNRMTIDLIDGPFRKLTGAWTFRSLREDACKVELELDFEFSGRLIDKAFGGVFGQVANSLVDAFCKRADEVFGD